MRKAHTTKKLSLKQRKILSSQQRITDFFPQLQPDLAVRVEPSPTMLSKLVASSSTPDAQTRFSILMAPCPHAIKILTASSIQSILPTPIPLRPHSPSLPPTVRHPAYNHPNRQSSNHSLNHANFYLPPYPIPKNSASAAHTPTGSPCLVVNSDRLAQTINAASSAGGAIINVPRSANRGDNPIWFSCRTHISESFPSALRSKK